MIQHVYERTTRARGLDRVVVLTDDERIAEAVRAFGGEGEMTPPDCPSGTDRIAYAARQWLVDAVVNVQGDEPLIDPMAIEAIVQHLRRDPEASVVTIATPAQPDELDNPNAVKVVCDLNGNALYFSRAPIPHQRDAAPATEGPAPGPPGAPSGTTVLKHLGIYGYRRDTLLSLARLEPTPLERSEALEQLRALEHGIPIHVLTADHAEPGVDTADDLARATARWRAVARTQETA